MPQSINSNIRAALAAALALVLAGLALAACGSSSKSSTTSTNASATTPGATTPTTAAGAAAARAGRFTALRTCLQKNGVTLPQRTPGQKASGGGLLSGAGPALPKGVTRARYEAAIKKCGGFTGGGGRFGGGRTRFSSPVFKQALTKFARCMDANGVKVPAPNTSGKGPIFNTKGLNTAGPQFKAAQTKCASVLRSFLRASPGSDGPSGPPPGSAPPTSG